MSDSQNNKSRKKLGLKIAPGAFNLQERFIQNTNVVTEKIAPKGRRSTSNSENILVEKKASLRNKISVTKAVLGKLSENTAAAKVSGNKENVETRELTKLTDAERQSRLRALESSNRAKLDATKLDIREEEGKRLVMKKESLNQGASTVKGLDKSADKLDISGVSDASGKVRGKISSNVNILNSSGNGHNNGSEIQDATIGRQGLKEEGAKNTKQIKGEDLVGNAFHSRKQGFKKESIEKENKDGNTGVKVVEDIVDASNGLANTIYATTKRNKVRNLDFLTAELDAKRRKEARIAAHNIELSKSKLNNAEVATSTHKKNLKKGTASLVGQEEAFTDSEEKKSGYNKSGKNYGSPSHRHKLSAAELSMLEDVDEDLDESSKLHNSIIREIVPSYSRPKKLKHKSKSGNQKMVRDKVIKEVVVPDYITVNDLANRMSEKGAHVVKMLIEMGVMATLNQTIDGDTAEIIVGELGHKVKRVGDDDWVVKLLDQNTPDKEEDMRERNPVVTIMGHVDHGKTSLLDALRSTDVTQSEHGGITQHIGAYKVTLANGKSIAFLDTPGHEAFTAMRMRGASITDIVIIVVAANDGIRAQTIEAIHHAKAAKTPIIVAINKVDLPNVSVEKVKNELMSHDLIPEELGGDTIVVPISAKNGQGIDKLEEAILLQAEFLNLRANIKKSAYGSVIESKIDKNKGTLTTFLVQRGILRVGDIVVSGLVSGRVRSMHDDSGVAMLEAFPGSPVELLGLSNPPSAGDDFIVLQDDKDAKALLDFRLRRQKEKQNIAVNKDKMSFDKLLIDANSGIKELALIVKADVQGSIGAILKSLSALPQQEVRLKIIHEAVGDVNESDVTLAAASNAVIVGFNVKANVNAKNLAQSLAVELRSYSVIYNLLDEIKGLMGNLLDYAVSEKTLGNAVVRQVFQVKKFGKIIGCYVVDGLVKRGASFRIKRGQEVIHEDIIKSLKKQKDDMKEVKAGLECGIASDNCNDVEVQIDDRVEIFEIVKEKRSL